MEQTQEREIDDTVKQEIINYCLGKRLSVKEKADDDCQTFVHVPLSIAPSPFPRESYEAVTEIQVSVNKLVEHMMMKIPRVRELFGNLQEKDEFIGGLIKISKAVEKAEHKQKGYLGILRSDYMHDKETNAPKLIEVNTIASSFGPLSWGINELHKHLINQYEMDVDLDKIEKAKNPKELIIESLKQAYNLYFDTDVESSEF